jgi:hypothetical protein
MALTLEYLFEILEDEINNQDRKHGPFVGTELGRSRLAVACVEDEAAEARDAWRLDRRAHDWRRTKAELLQTAAVALRAYRDI